VKNEIIQKSLKNLLTLAQKFDILRPHTENINTSHMRTKTLLLTAALSAAGALSSMAQVYSVNIVGYINLTLPKGFSMIANQLNATPDNKLSTVIPAPPENTTIYKFNGNGYNTFNYSADNPGWAPDTGTLAPGDGAFIAIDPAFAPTGTTLTLVGEVQLVSSTSIPNGFSVRSSVLPISDTLDNLGFPARENDNLYLFSNATGHYVVYNFSADNPGWAPPNPTPKVGESFFVAGDPAFGAPRTWNRSFVVGPP
jgi:hypothetical protein